MLDENRFVNYYANDISDSVILFAQTRNGMFKNERRWISREDFNRLKDTDHYVKWCWSFGNKGKNYLYSTKIEPYKKACHYAIVFDEWDLMKKLCPEVWEVAYNAIKDITDLKQRRLKFAPAIVRELKRLGDWETVINNPLYKSCHWRGGKLDGKQNDLQSLQSLERLERLESLQSLVVSQGDYRQVKIKPDSVIYCDIPYFNTADYGVSFNHQEFYDWCNKQTELVIISEYYMPQDNFICIGEKEKSVTLQSGGKNKALEKMFIPKHQKQLYYSLMNKGTLFEAV